MLFKSHKVRQSHSCSLHVKGHSRKARRITSVDMAVQLRLPEASRRLRQAESALARPGSWSVHPCKPTIDVSPGVVNAVSTSCCRGPCVTSARVDVSTNTRHGDVLSGIDRYASRRSRMAPPPIDNQGEELRQRTRRHFTAAQGQGLTNT